MGGTQDVDVDLRESGPIVVGASGIKGIIGIGMVGELVGLIDLWGRGAGRGVGLGLERARLSLGGV